MASKEIKYWVACSGGVDSVVLVHLMNAKNLDFGILHCNFQLRGKAADKDELFVRELAENLHIPLRVQVFDTQEYMSENGLNLELAARELRYNWFDEIIKKENATVLLAQHYDDQMETFFLQLRRGGRIKGLSGMPVDRNGYLRPLLKYRKATLIALAKKQQWRWREDESNRSNKFKRNWYRNEVLPFLANNQFPVDEVVPLVNQFQEILNVFQQFKLPQTFSKREWNAAPILWKHYVLSTHQLGEYNVQEITRLLEGEKGKYIGNDRAEVWNEGDTLVFIDKKDEINNFSINVEKIDQKKVDFSNKELLFVDVEKIEGDLSFRKWQSGDYFQPLGMKGEKTMGKFLRDKKVPSHLKRNVFVLLDDSNTLVGVFGFGIGERFKIDKNTNDCLKISLFVE